MVVLAAAVLVLVGYLAFGRGGSSTAGTSRSSGAGTSSESDPPSPDTATSDEPTDQSTSDEPTDEPTETPTVQAVELPSGATPCSATFHDDSAALQHSAKGNAVTTCPFAENVRRAYLNEGDVTGAVVVSAHSPVTGRTYTMTCEGTSPVTCTGGTNAVVYLY